MKEFLHCSFKKSGVTDFIAIHLIGMNLGVFSLPLNETASLFFNLLNNAEKKMISISNAIT